MKFANTSFACHCIQIDGIICEYIAEIHISEKYETRIIINDVNRECVDKVKDKDNVIIVFRKDEKYITAITSYSAERSYRYCEESDYETGITLKYISTKLLYGFRPKDNSEILFKGFTCEVTGGLELIGAYPYEIENKDNGINGIEMYIKGKYILQPSVKGFSYFVAPVVSKKKDSIQVGMEYKIQYASDEGVTLDRVDELLRKVVLFLEILCGEFVTTTKVYLDYGNESCEYVGNCNYTKYELRHLKNGLDTRSYLRKKIFKITDFGTDLENTANVFEKIVQDRLLSYEAYKQVLLDEEVGIYTYNKFLKLMQIIEGYQRTDASEVDKKKFDDTKNRIIGNLKNESDKEFIKEYTIDNGEKFKTCLREFICKGLGIVSECTKLNRKAQKLIYKITNDRNAYTHASLTYKPILKETELDMINYCCEVFFRIANLSEMGLSDEIIRKRLRFDWMFMSYYKDLFGLDIKLSENWNHTEDYDSQMWGYQ